MRRIVEELQDGRPRVSDGAWGTLLQTRGLPAGVCPELWCVEHPDVVRDIAREYAAAGAALIKTNSFGGSRIKLAAYGLAHRAFELNEAAAALSREAAGQNRHVLGSMGPTGKMLFLDEVSADALYEAFAEQASALERGGADACCIETMSALDEALVAVRAVRENTKLEIICTFTFEKTQMGDYRTMMGVSPDAMAEALVQAGVDIIGSNCGNGMQQMADIARAIRRVAPQTPILIHANAGLPVYRNGQVFYPETPEVMAKQARDVIRAGANIVGGCCGTTPEHIRALVHALQHIGTPGG